jgi:hypothetical protein
MRPQSAFTRLLFWASPEPDARQTPAAAFGENEVNTQQ